MLSVFDQGPPPPCPAPFNMAAYVLAAAQQAPDKIALSILRPTSAEHWSFARLKTAVLGVAAGLLDAGLAPGDKVLIRIGNTVEFPISFLACIAVGLVPVPTSAQLTEPEVSAIVASLAPRAILHQSGIACPMDHPNRIDTDTLRGWFERDGIPFDMGDPDRLAYIIYTSGTSGRPRAVAHAHRAIWARRMMHHDWTGLQQDDRLCHAGAFNWTYTLGTGLLDPWSVGATALIPAEGVAHDRLALLLQRNDATIFAAAPGVYRNILKQNIAPMPRLRHGLSAGEKLSDPIRQAWKQATGTEIFEAYGMSECSTFISGSPAHQAKAGTLGRPQTGRRVALVGADGPVPMGRPGTIAVHRDAPGLMLGYLDAPQETRDRFHGDWFLTGDNGVMTPEGDIAYLGRDDDMMNAGGYRVSPLEVEAALAAHPDVQEIGVTEVEVKPGVRVIGAFFTGPIDAARLEQFASAQLARYKQPRVFVPIDAMPRNPNGKLSRRALRDLYPSRD